LHVAELLQWLVHTRDAPHESMSAVSL